jgi:hypothetical protein
METTLRSETAILLEMRETLLDMRDTIYSDRGLYNVSCERYDALCTELEIVKLSRLDTKD